MVGNNENALGGFIQAQQLNNSFFSVKKKLHQTLVKNKEDFIQDYFKREEELEEVREIELNSKNGKGSWEFRSPLSKLRVRDSWNENLLTGT